MSNIAKLIAIRARIAKLQAEEAKLAELAVGEVDTSKLAAGDVVTFVYGRGDNARRIEGGVVLGIKGGNGERSPTVVRVQFGQGVDTEIVGVFPSQITAITKPEAAAAE